MSFVFLKYNVIFNYLHGIKSEYLGFYSSFFFHLLILLFVVGIPNFFETKPIMIPSIIPIEIINVTDVTSVPKDIKETKSANLKKTEVKQNKFNSSNNQEIKKIKTNDKPRLEDNKIQKKILLKESIDIKEKVVLPLELDKEKISLDTNIYESLPTKKIKPKLKPKVKIENTKKILRPDISIKPKLKPKIENTKKIIQSDKRIDPVSKPKPDFNTQLATMMKDLRNEKSNYKIEEKVDKKKFSEITNNNEEKELNDKVQLSISEIDLVLQQLSRCFIAPAGSKIEKTMFVKIAAKIQRNRRVYTDSIRIIDTNIPQSSPVYGPITESAMRTLLNPECMPLKLPEDKYDRWKNLTVIFDYSVMRGN